MRATYFLILAEISAYLLLSPYPNAAFSFLGFSTSGLLLGRIWTPFTSIFVHVDLFHLGTNLLFLYIFGIALEEKIGALRTMTIFFVAGVLSLLAGVPFYSPDTHIVGAPIAVSALVGAAFVLTPGRISPLTLFAPLGLVIDRDLNAARNLAEWPGVARTLETSVEGGVQSTAKAADSASR